jgi:phosphoribosyl 1,2-cyclic phosphodiesterase
MTDEPATPPQMRLYGVRAGLPWVGPAPSAYGGNTACVEVHWGTSHLVFDLGTGARDLGLALLAAAPLEADIFFSTLHYEHLSGLPFCAAAFNPQNGLRLHAGGATGALEAALDEMMSAPLFPIPRSFLGAVRSIDALAHGEQVAVPGGPTITAFAIEGTPDALAYRIEGAAGTVAILGEATSIAPPPPGLLDRADLALLAAPADKSVAGEPGRSWQDALHHARGAGVRRLALTHHRHDRDDDALDAIASALKSEMPGAILAREGATLTLP